MYKLNKALYDMKQAHIVWYNMIDNHPRELGFTRSEHEYTFYLKEDNDGHKLIMSLYVDDMLVIGSNATIIEDIKRERQSMCI